MNIKVCVCVLGHGSVGAYTHLPEDQKRHRQQDGLCGEGRPQQRQLLFGVGKPVEAALPRSTLNATRIPLPPRASPLALRRGLDHGNLLDKRADARSDEREGRCQCKHPRGPKLLDQ